MITAPNFDAACSGAWATGRAPTPGITLSDVFARLAEALDADAVAAPAERHVQGYARPDARRSHPAC